jgi:ribonuclease HI
MNPHIIFTDGASKGNPGPGGWGAVLLSRGTVTEFGGREDRTTNNRMELFAVIRSLQSISPDSGSITVYTDSSYVVNGITKWVTGWQNKHWKTATGGDVLNQDLWQELVEACAHKKISWNMLPGHSGIPGNERADVIASGYADGSDVNLYTGPLDDYSINLLNFSIDSKKYAEKKSRKQTSNAKAYSYISLLGGKLIRHNTWADCEKRVKGQRGARYRKTLSKEDEDSIIYEWKKQ